MTKSALIFAALAGAALGHGQAVPNLELYGPDVAVPQSNVRHLGDSVHRRYTNYLLYQGVWRHSSMDDGPTPLAMIAEHGPAAFRAPTAGGYHPSDIQAAYGMPANGGQGAIAIIDADSDPSILSDFNTFCNEFGLPVETSPTVTASTNQVFQVVYAAGTVPPYDNGWAGEESLDVEWAHAVAPGAKIYLVEAAGASDAQLDAAVQVAATLPNVTEVSMSFGSQGEYAGEQTEDSVYTQPGVVYFGATGDTPANRGYPAMSPNVVAAGGTTINLLQGAVVSESVWSGGGCGPSQYVPRPSYQSSLAAIVGQFRGTPDVSADADPNTGVAVYNSNDIGQPYNSGGWEVDGGTSLASPICAAITNVRGNYSASSFAEHTRLYGQIGTSNIRDITFGSIKDPDGTVYAAKAGYDLASGLGEPVLVYPTTNLTTTAATATAPTGALIGGSVGNLNSVDGKCFVVSSRLVVGAGQEASAQASYTPTPPPGYHSVSTLHIVVNAAAISGATEQIEVLNVVTSQYDTVGTVALATASTTTSIAANPTNYVAANGTVTIRLVAERPERLGMSPFTYRIDEAILSATFS